MQWVFDLDDTLYGPAVRLKDIVVPRIKGLIMAATGIPESDYEKERNRLRHDVFLTNDTLLAFSLAYGLPYEDLVRAAYLDLPWNKLPVELRPGVKDLARLPGKKIILSNAPKLFAEKILSHFSLRNAFAGILASERGTRIHKPDASAFDLVRTDDHTVIVDNHSENLREPARRGWETVLFPDTEITEAPSWVQRVIRSIDDL